MRRRILLEVIVGLLVLLFVYTAVSKLIGFGKYEWQMRNQPLPEPLADILIWAVPVAELIASVLLVIRGSRLLGLLFCSCLLFVFTGYVGLVMSSAFSCIPCSCAGIFEKMSWPMHLVVNIFFLLISLLGIVLERRTIISREGPV